MKLTTLLFLLLPSFLFAQELVSELNGFKLGQYKITTKNEYGKPYDVTNFEDGFVAEVFFLNTDQSAYTIFEYSNWDKNSIWSIQVYGTDPNLGTFFKGIHLGMKKADLLAKVGQPTSYKNVGEYGEMLIYENTNYSFEVNTQGVLSSIKIIDTTLENSTEDSEPTSFDILARKLTSKNKNEVASVLSPSLEIYKYQQILFFKNSWEKEVKNDNSEIFKTIKKISKKLRKVDQNKEEEFISSLRVFSEYPQTMFVIKLPKHKYINEIVLRNELGEYKVYEIKLKSADVKEKKPKGTYL
ncbi:hypothetical protein MY04_2953 [Flammeovirga sp. MY04]|nr:hypothetical protein [Flammeovirga sp. MY04]ANQ50321.1 hypothetical protein MY04_2953 [Flammeovirga sp. MY04]